MIKPTPVSLPTYLAGLGAATLLATTSNAAVVTMDVSSISGPNAGIPSESLLEISMSDLTDGALTVPLQGFNASLGVGLGTGPSTSFSIATGSGKASPVRFSDGDTIDSGDQFSTDFTRTVFYYPTEEAIAPDWGPGSYLGFKVDENDTDTYYGWLEITWDSDTQVFQILSGAYESTPGVGISVPRAIPEPSSLALLALGASGLAALRRRKKAA
ncbi:MAG TPA: PEP-CTERM sorting domain-containing protein [Chthoniobacteraceae bacterium]|nr:PEP-CTERM sorting domain-containing protein [Chthoniobacteraceae bacterium]